MKKIFLITIYFLIIQKVYSQRFNEIAPAIHGINQGNIMWGDYDGDSDLDVFAFGGQNLGEYRSGLYRNDAGVFVETYVGTFDDLIIGDSDWGDYDNDGDLDIILTGSIDSSPLGGRTKIFENTGSGFKESFENQIHAFIGGALAWGDFDNDGDLDLAIGGEEAKSGSNNPRNFEIYENRGSEFRMIYQEINTGINLGSVDWGDYDNDGDLDLLVTGFSFGSNTFRTSAVIDNNAQGFARNTNIQLIGVASGSGEWGDYDNDGDLDILLNGSTYENGDFDRNTFIFENTDSKFNLVFKDAIIGTEEGEATWGDFDNDGDLDILVIGRASNDYDDLHARIYENTGNGFTVFEDLTKGIRIGSVAWGDYENDGDLDILLSGQDTESITFTRIYVNTIGSNEFSQNTPPLAPDNLSAQTTSSRVVLFWDDSQTQEESLTYNLHLRSTTDTIVTSQSRADGLRKVVKEGNVGFAKSRELELEPGDYFWKVQGIDNSFQGSPFAKEESFHINFPPVILGTTSPLSTAQEIPLTIGIPDLIIEDPDNALPTDFSLEVHSGDNYSVSNNEITPNANFFGVLAVPITVSDGTDVSEIFTVMIEVVPILGLENSFFSENFSVYPNPVEGYVNVQPIDNLKSFELNVYDSNGRLLYSNHKPSGEITIDISDYSAGSYILRVLSDNKLGSTIILKK